MALSIISELHEPKHQIEIPVLDLNTFIFSSGSRDQRSRQQYFDADHPEQSFSLEQALIYVKRWAYGLQKLGLKPDDKVLLYSGNSLWFPILYWGTIAAGCVFTGCSPTASVTELAYQLNDSDAKILITGPEGIESSLRAAAKSSVPRNRIYEFNGVSSTGSNKLVPSWSSIWAAEHEVREWSWKAFSSLQEAQDTTAAINYSSGTTGVPKGVEISHYNIVSNSMQLLYKRGMVGKTPAAKARKDRLDLSGERWLAPLPMFHAYGQMYYCVSAARLGAKVFIMKQYSLERYLKFLDIYRITFLTGVPTLMVALSKSPLARSYNFKAIETVVTGSAPLEANIGKAVQEALLRPGVLVKQGWGLTECTCSATGFAPDDVDDGRSVGWLNPNVSIKIVTAPDHEFEAQREVAQLIGEIWVSGPNVMKGYYKRPEETLKTFVYEDGRKWLRTGDVGYIDSRGRMYIIDRIKELIKVKGLQVAPAEIEQTLLTHPSISDAAVVAERRPEGEFPKAFIVKATSSLTAREVQDFIQARMSKHKWLTAGVFFVDTIPRTASGKVMRRMLQTTKSQSSTKAAVL